MKHFRRQKIYFGALESQFGSKNGSKKANFCKLGTKFDHLRSIEPRELDWWTIFLVYVMGNMVRGEFVGTSM